MSDERDDLAWSITGKNARTHILHLYLDPLPIAGGADPREPTANPANAHHSSSSSIAVLVSYHTPS